MDGAFAQVGHALEVFEARHARLDFQHRQVREFLLRLVEGLLRHVLNKDLVVVINKARVIRLAVHLPSSVGSRTVSVTLLVFRAISFTTRRKVIHL